MIKKFKWVQCLLASSLVLTACSTVSTLPSVQKPIASTSPVIDIVPDLTPAAQLCDQLKAQFQTQLPSPILNLIQWTSVAARDPLQATGPLLPVCQLSLSTNGETIQKSGLTPNFVTAVLERLDWTNDAALNAYVADSPTGHQEAMHHDNHLTIMRYSFAPPADACPKNQPIAACKVSKKKWIYQLTVAFWRRDS